MKYCSCLSIDTKVHSIGLLPTSTGLSKQGHVLRQQVLALLLNFVDDIVKEILKEISKSSGSNTCFRGVTLAIALATEPTRPTSHLLSNWTLHTLPAVLDIRNPV